MVRKLFLNKVLYIVLFLLVSSCTILIPSGVEKKGGSGNNTYTVTYDGNGNTGGSAPIDANNYEQGVAVTVSGATTLEKSGYTFMGWNTAADGTGTNYAAASTFKMGTEDVTLYARWTRNPTYTVTYDGNGNTDGDVPTDMNHYEQGVTVGVAGAGTLEKSGYTFVGWNTAANGSGTTYAIASTFKMGAKDVTLYARWTRNPTYTVTYDGNGNTDGDVPTDTNNYEQGMTVTIVGAGTLVRSGYKFAGWNTAMNGSGISYTEASTFVMGTTNEILYAQWTLNHYTVTYDGNNSISGDAPVDANSYIYGSAVTVVCNPGKLVNGLFYFAGWNTAEDGSGTNYSSGDAFVITSDVTLYAKWVLSFNLRDRGPACGWIFYIDPDGAKLLPSGTNYLEAAPYDQSTGIQWWNGGPAWTGAYDYSIGAGQSNTTKIITTYSTGNYAAYLCTQQTIGGYSDWFLPSGHELDRMYMNLQSGTDEHSVSYTTVGGFSSNNYGYYGYWSSTTGEVNSITGVPYRDDLARAVGFGGDNQYDVGRNQLSPVRCIRAVSLPSYTVTYDGNGSTGGDVPVDANNYLSGATAKAVCNPGDLVNGSYYFAGWNTAEDGSGTNYYGGDTFVITSDVTLYAKWVLSFNLRDRGPACGWIFYVDPAGAKLLPVGQTYLEAAPSDQSSGQIWSNIVDAEMGTTGIAIGTGQTNTTNIMAQGGHTNSAAKLCDDYVEGDYNEWFLPSLDELNQAYVQLKAYGVGGFADDFYWTSSEINYYGAWVQVFSNSSQGVGYKGSAFRVRCVMAF